MKISICASRADRAQIDALMSALSAHVKADLFVCDGAAVELILNDSDLVLLWTTAAYAHDSICLGEALRLNLSLIAILVQGAQPEALPVGTTLLSHYELRSDHFEHDLEHMAKAIGERLARLNDARHEYNNIAAIASLSNSPSILAQARILLTQLREKFPEYTDDPQGLNSLLGINAVSK